MSNTTWSLATESSEVKQLRSFRPASQFFVVMFGLLLPLAALVIEAAGHLCADVWFDPIPTPGHMLLVATVPLVSLLYLLGRPNRFFDLLAGAATMVAFLYSLPFLPLVPLAICAIPFAGVGFLPLAPILSLATMAIVVRRAARPKAYALGMLGAGLALVALWVPAALTASWMDQGSIAFLRHLGDRPTMLRACHEERPSNPVARIMRPTPAIGVERSRRLYFQVTGKRAELEPLPARTRTFDTSEEVQSSIRQTVSRLDGSIDPDAALAYTEWTIELENTAGWNQEGTMEVALPTSAVVSRATLWVAGEEREAAYAKVGQARQAYEAVVQTNRDPLLVTTAGPGRIEARCFPIPPHGKMRFKLGITSPLTLASERQAVLETPRIVHSNFQALSTADAYFESRTLLSAPGLDPGRILRGPVNLPTRISAQRNRQVTEVWAPLGQQFVQARLATTAPPERIALVLDSSAGMARHWPQVGQVVQALKPDRIFYPSDRGAEETTSIREISPEGGKDNLPPLMRALEHYQTVVWLHADQPYAGDSLTGLQQMLERSPRDLIDVSLDGGLDAVLAELQLPGLRTLARTGDDLAADLKRLRQPQLEYRLERVSKQPEGQETSSHLARLWAWQEYGRLWPRPEATRLALEHRLITPSTGAVVLETKEQYRNAGLEPVDESTVPTVPEPGTMALLGAAAAAALARRRKAA